MEIFIENIHVIVCAVILVVAAIVFIRRGQIDLLKQLIASVSNGIDVSEFYEKLPALTRLLISSGKVEELARESAEDQLL